MPEELLRKTILANVHAYFNDEVPYAPQRDEKATVQNVLREEYRRRMDARPFIEKLKEKYQNELEMYAKNCQADRAVFDERGFEMEPIEYRNEIFKKCRYVTIGFDNRNPAITYPFWHIKGEVLVEKIKNLKVFIDKNIQKMKENRDEAILDLAALPNEDYSWSCIDGRREHNSNILGLRCKSFLLYYNYPDFYPLMTTNDMYSLLMLTAQNGRIRPEQCEFVIYNRTGNWADSNANYPYEQFVYYAATIYDEIKSILEQKKETFVDMDTCKYILVEVFFRLVYEYNGQQLEIIRTRPADRELPNRR